MYSLAQNGRLLVWKCNTGLDGLLPFEQPQVAETTDDQSGDEQEADGEVQRKSK